MARVSPALRAELAEVVHQAAVVVRQDLMVEWTDCAAAAARDGLWLQVQTLEALEHRLMEAIDNGGN